jgi:hypothetical protein
MPTVKVPLFSAVYRGVNQEELSDLNYELIDGYVDELGFTNRRPGLVEVLDLGLGANKPVEGLFWFPQKGFALAVCDNKIWKITSTSGTLSAEDITTDGPGTAGPPSFCVGVDSNVTSPVIYGIIAAGGAMIEGHGVDDAISDFATIGDSDAPTAVSHIDFVDGYVLALTGKSFFQYSVVNDPTSWVAASFATAMRNPDDTQSMMVLKRQPVFVGQVTTEIWENDGASPFAPVEGGFHEVGTVAKYSLCKGDDSLFWLDHTRHFVQLKNGSIERISTPFDDEIQEFSSVSDCIGYQLQIKGKPFLIFQFPTEERTLAYNITKKDWGEWKFYDSSVGEYRHFLGKSYCYAPDWGLHLIGSRAESKIYSFTPDAKDDNGQPIRLQKTTGHLNYGTTARKRSKELRIRCKRGEGLNGADAKMMIRWKDDNNRWANERMLSLGNIGETETVIRVDVRGAYRTRQYEIVVTDAVSVTFGDAEEDVEVLPR